MSRMMLLALVVAVALGGYRWRHQRVAEARRGPAVVVLYSVTGCQTCAHMKSWLQERHLPYQDRNYESLSRSDLLTLARRSSLRVFPQLEINGQFFSGQDESAVKQAIDAL